MENEGLKGKIISNLSTITLIAGVLGILPHIIGLIPIDLSVISDVILPINYVIDPNVHFSIPMSSIFYAFNHASGQPYNYLSLVFFGIMLYGYYVYINGGDKKTKLILFSFSIILFAQLINLAGFLIATLLDPQGLMDIGLRGLAELAAIVSWAYMAYHIVHHLLNRKVGVKVQSSNELLDDSFGAIDNDVHSGLVLTSNSQRLIHHVVDSVLILTLCASQVWYIGESFFWDLEYSVGMNIALGLALIIGRFIYYPFFETALGTTPGKILTDSVVLKADNTTVKLGDSINRTLSRIVPFEPFSFLGNNPGWHDRWTKTKVVKREASLGLDEEGFDQII